MGSMSKKDGLLPQQPSIDEFSIPPIGNMTSLTSINYNQMEDGFDAKNRTQFK